MDMDHVCIAVRSIEKAQHGLCELFGYEPRTGIVTNTRQKVNVQFLGKQGSLDIKLIEPAGLDSPLCDFIKKGGGLHHICFKTEKLDDAVIDLQDKGARLLAGPEPGEAFDDELIAFLYAGHGLNFEVTDTDKRRLKINN
jgi:methylmalonyl-CoA/ethylmalonyl-CoA epimerase